MWECQWGFLHFEIIIIAGGKDCSTSLNISWHKNPKASSVLRLFIKKCQFSFPFSKHCSLLLPFSSSPPMQCSILSFYWLHIEWNLFPESTLVHCSLKIPIEFMCSAELHCIVFLCKVASRMFRTFSLPVFHPALWIQLLFSRRQLRDPNTLSPLSSQQCHCSWDPKGKAILGCSHNPAFSLTGYFLQGMPFLLSFHSFFLKTGNWPVEPSPCTKSILSLSWFVLLQWCKTIFRAA